MTDRTLVEVERALHAVTSLAWARAVDPRNVAKGHWQDQVVLALALHLAEEVGELAQAIRRGTLEQVEHEAGDVVWSTAMLLDAVRKQRESGKA